MFDVNPFISWNSKFRHSFISDTIVVSSLSLAMVVSSCNKLKVAQTHGTTPPTQSVPEGPIVAETSIPSNRSIIESKLDLQLQLLSSTDVSDLAMHEALKDNCTSCHSDSTPSANLDLTILPPHEKFEVIKSRIGATSANPMPPGSSLVTDAKTLMLTWIQNQITPLTNDFDGFTISAVNSLTLENLVVEQGSNGRFKVKLGSMPANSHLTINIVVIGPDHISQLFLGMDVSVDNLGRSYTVLKINERDRTPPVISNMSVSPSSVTHTDVTLTWSQAADGDRPVDHLTYKVYQLQNETSESVVSIEANGVRMGEDIVGTNLATLTTKVTGLTAATKYYFAIIVQDLEGNKTAYKTVEVLTAQPVICAAIIEAGSITKWRDGLASTLMDSSNDNAVTANIKSCYPANVPKCVERMNGYALKDDYADSSLDGTIATLAQKQPPEELRDPQNPSGYWIPDNIEDVAKQKGWTTVRYRSRHAGGFDGDTPNLMMVYVPGDKVTPPVKFDRWLNFPLPRDYADSAPLESLDPTPTLGPPKREDYALPHNFPGTFTMVSQDLSPSDVPESTRVYFQMFRRKDQSPTFLQGGVVDVRGGCVSCHPNGLRAISPMGYDVRAGEKSLSKDNWDAVELINRKMIEAANNLPPKWGDGVSAEDGVSRPFYRPDFLGPIVGSAKPVNGLTRKKEFIMGGVIEGQQISGCYNLATSRAVTDIFSRTPGMGPNNRFELSPLAAQNIDPDKVIRAMNCEGCHGGTGGAERKRSPIYDVSSQVAFKILVDQSMPQGIHTNRFNLDHTIGESVDGLNADERMALLNCLEAEFKRENTSENILKWLKQESCHE